MYKHNEIINDEIRKDNEIYNQNFLKKIGLNNIKNIKGTINREDWELTGFNIFQTVWLNNIDRIMYFIKKKKINTNDYTLIDMGSGNGIACIYFAFKFKFRKIIGLEICKDLHKQSLSFLEIFSRKMNFDITKINFIRTNMLDYKLDDKKYFLFFFNSVNFEILELFIKKNINCLKKNKCIFLLVNDHCINDILTYCKIIQRNDFYNISVVQF